MSDRPERATADGRPNSADPARYSPPPGTIEPAGPEAHEPAETTAGDEAALTEPAAAAPFGEPPPAAALAHSRNYRGLALGLAATLLLVLALIGTAPLWAPLLPWGDERAGIDPAISERLDAEQQEIRALQQQIAAAAAAMPKLEQRVGAFEQKPATRPPELDEMRQRIAAVSAGTSDLTSRLERLANSVEAQAAGIADLTTRLDRSEQAQLAEIAAKLDPLQQLLQTQQAATAELASRLLGLEKAERARTGDLTDMGLTLALLQIRDAVDAGRPFSAEYDALSSLAKARPEIAAAAAPLAAAAPTGAKTHGELARELRALGQKLDAAATESAGDGGWAGAALDRLRGLVRVRRADEAAPTKEAEAGIAVAERALAGGDLARAVAAVEMLQGPAAALALDWLGQARERLAVQAALQRLQGLLTGRLGDTAAMPGSPR